MLTDSFIRCFICAYINTIGFIHKWRQEKLGVSKSQNFCDIIYAISSIFAILSVGFLQVE